MRQSLFSQNIVWLWRPPNQTQTYVKENIWDQLAGFLMFQHNLVFVQEYLWTMERNLEAQLGVLEKGGRQYWLIVLILCILCFWQYLLWQHSVYCALGNIFWVNIQSIVGSAILILSFMGLVIWLWLLCFWQYWSWQYLIYFGVGNIWYVVFLAILNVTIFGLWLWHDLFWPFLDPSWR